MTVAVQIEDLYRAFPPPKRDQPPTVALDSVTLSIAAGHLHGLLGPNGAGKTTLCKILSTVLLPTSGTAKIFGHDVASEPENVRPHLGLAFGGDRGLYTRLTARENLEYWAALHGLSRNEQRRRAADLLARFGIADRADERVERFSRGMKQRVHLARSLVSEPTLLLLDEPTMGMDPVAAQDLRHVIRNYQDEHDCTILLTTHDMVEASELCDQVTLIDHGAILATESPATIGGWIADYESITFGGATPQLLHLVQGLEGVVSVRENRDGSVRVDVNSSGAVSRVLECLVQAGATSINSSLPSLQDVYVHFIGTRGMEV